jgi:hypothetical protein
MDPKAWLVLIVLWVLIFGAPAVSWWLRGSQEIAKNPALRSGYRKLILGWLTWHSIPLLILGAIYELPDPFLGPPLVVLGATLCIQGFAASCWVLFGSGAEQLVAHPGLLAGSPDRWTIRGHASAGAVFSALGLLGIGSLFALGYIP